MGFLGVQRISGACDTWLWTALELRGIGRALRTHLSDGKPVNSFVRDCMRLSSGACSEGIAAVFILNANSLSSGVRAFSIHDGTGEVREGTAFHTGTSPLPTATVAEIGRCVFP